MAKALGSGMVQGTRAVGSGVVQGSLVVSTGVMQGSKGVVQGTLAAGKLTKDVTLAVGKGVYHASEVVGNAAVTGVSAASEATLSAGRVVTNASVSAVIDTTKWVKEQSESFGCEEQEAYTVLPGDTLEEIANRHNLHVHDLIRVNRLQQRTLFPGKQIVIPEDADQIQPHPEEVFVTNAFLIKIGQSKDEVFLRFSTDKFSALYQGNLYMQCNPKDVSRIQLDIYEIVEHMPDLLPPAAAQEVTAHVHFCPDVSIQGQDCHVVQVHVENDIKSTTNKKAVDDFYVTLELEFTNEDQDDDGKSQSHDGRSHKFYFNPTDLLSLHAYLDLWHSERLQKSQLFEKHLNVESSGWVDCNDVGPQVLDKSSILDERSIIKIYRSLPQKIWNQSWKLAYSTRVNGFSLLNLYRTLSEDSDPSLLVVNDTYGFTFGAYLTCTPRMSDCFIGTGKSWLFSFGRLEKSPRVACRPARSSDSQEDPNLRVVESSLLNVFQWSGQNEYFFKGTSDNMFLGAGDGKFGIIIDGDLHKGRIQECQTFDGWAPQEHDFLINCLEIWKFV